MKKAIARELGTEPKPLLIDEPTEGLMPAVVAVIAETVQHILRDGVAVVLVEQNTKVALATSQRIYLIEKGIIKYEGTATNLGRDHATRFRCLGE